MKQNWISLRGCWSCKSCQKNVWQLFKERDITTRFRDSAMFSCQRLYLVRIQLMGHVQHPLNKSRVSIGPIPIQDMHGLGAETVTLPHFCPYKSSSVAKLLFSKSEKTPPKGSVWNFCSTSCAKALSSASANWKKHPDSTEYPSGSCWFFWLLTMKQTDLAHAQMPLLSNTGPKSLWGQKS